MGTIVPHGLSFDVAHLLAGGLVCVSFMMLYQDRLTALLHVLALHAFVLALSVAWQAYIQDAPHLYITAIIAWRSRRCWCPTSCAGWCSAWACTGRSRPSAASA